RRKWHGGHGFAEPQNRRARRSVNSGSTLEPACNAGRRRSDVGSVRSVSSVLVLFSCSPLSHAHGHQGLGFGDPAAIAADTRTKARRTYAPSGPSTRNPLLTPA